AGRVEAAWRDDEMLAGSILTSSLIVVPALGPGGRHAPLRFADDLDSGCGFRIASDSVATLSFSDVSLLVSDCPRLGCRRSNAFSRRKGPMLHLEKIAGGISGLPSDVTIGVPSPALARPLRDAAEPAPNLSSTSRQPSPTQLGLAQPAHPPHPPPTPPNPRPTRPTPPNPSPTGPTRPNPDPTGPKPNPSRPKAQP